MGWVGYVSKYRGDPKHCGLLLVSILQTKVKHTHTHTHKHAWDGIGLEA